jgi:hypothetical protein
MNDSAAVQDHIQRRWQLRALPGSHQPWRLILPRARAFLPCPGSVPPSRPGGRRASAGWPLPSVCCRAGRRCRYCAMTSVQEPGTIRVSRTRRRTWHTGHQAPYSSSAVTKRRALSAEQRWAEPAAAEGAEHHFPNVLRSGHRILGLAVRRREFGQDSFCLIGGVLANIVALYFAVGIVIVYMIQGSPAQMDRTTFPVGLPLYSDYRRQRSCYYCRSCGLASNEPCEATPGYGSGFTRATAGA